MRYWIYSSILLSRWFPPDQYDRSVGNIWYLACTSSKRANRRGWVLNIFTWFIGSGGERYFAFHERLATPYHCSDRQRTVPKMQSWAPMMMMIAFITFYSSLVPLIWRSMYFKSIGIWFLGFQTESNRRILSSNFSRCTSKLFADKCLTKWLFPLGRQLLVQRQTNIEPLCVVIEFCRSVNKPNPLVCHDVWVVASERDMKKVVSPAFFLRKSVMVERNFM